MKRTKIWKQLLTRSAGLPQWRMKQRVRMGPRLNIHTPELAELWFCRVRIVEEEE